MIFSVVVPVIPAWLLSSLNTVWVTGLLGSSGLALTCGVLPVITHSASANSVAFKDGGFYHQNAGMNALLQCVQQCISMIAKRFHQSQVTQHIAHRLTAMLWGWQYFYRQCRDGAVNRSLYRQIWSPMLAEGIFLQSTYSDLRKDQIQYHPWYWSVTTTSNGIDGNQFPYTDRPQLHHQLSVR